MSCWNHHHINKSCSFSEQKNYSSVCFCSINQNHNLNNNDEVNNKVGSESDQLMINFGDLNGFKFGALLDIGAGDGNVTAIMSPYFEQTYATEMSKFMHSRLIKRGYHLLDTLDWHHQTSGNRPIDLICLLNVLDRYVFYIKFL